ncbi:MAG: ribose-5-phosphate isomerase RpiA [Halobacteriota archaeon]|nr:ribose-5-phosphate isomerase RpiA [Halobacteriota archaeon]
MDDLKKIAAEGAAGLVEDGMIIGLGTGSTAAYVIKAIGERIKEEKIEIMAVPTSLDSEILASECNITLTTLSENPVLDLAIDGADQVDPKLNLIKGKGGALTREKIVASSANKFVVCVDESKVVDILDDVVPLEVIPIARNLVEKRIFEMNGKPELRMAVKKIGPVITDNGNIIIDVAFGEIDEPEALARELSSIVGVIEHGIFTDVYDVFVGREGKAETMR